MSAGTQAAAAPVAPAPAAVPAAGPAAGPAVVAAQAAPGSVAAVPAPALGISRLLLVVTGAVAAAELPYWLGWLRSTYPSLELRIAMTASAERFVSRVTLAGHSGAEVLPDRWAEDEVHARHVLWTEWAEAVVVAPATLHFMARLALGLADSPALLAAQCTTAPVVLLPALPPGGLHSAAYRAHHAALAARPNVAVLPPRPGLSMTTGREDAWAPAPLPDALAMVEQCRRELAAAVSAPLPPPASTL
ncbi:flavoprotein [Streptomyces sp. NRRL F-4474]|uniref:flavoprotein n=1 Tax=Streptomyces sp. NRRL F-4474 TaxID=1463851 RepID=UPI000AABA164|nr:flavoprotein [Streptomyces sp. NRRL F-4474]